MTAKSPSRSSTSSKEISDSHERVICFEGASYFKDVQARRRSIIRNERMKVGSPKFHAARRSLIEVMPPRRLKLEKDGLDVYGIYRCARFEPLRKGHTKAMQ